MKKFITIIICLAAAMLLETGFVRNMPFMIYGTWERDGTPYEISLFQVVSGRLEKVSVALVQDNGAFVIAHNPPAEGFYVVGIGDPSSRVDKYIFYLKSGDNLNLVVNNTSYTLVGENTRENRVMKMWHDFIQPLERQSFYSDRISASEIHVDFFSLLQEKIERPYVAPRTGNRRFDEIFAEYHPFDLMHCAVNFVTTPQRRLPKNEDLPDFYKNLDIENFDNTEILVYPYLFLPKILLAQDKFGEKPISNGNPHLALMNILTNDTLKGEIFLTILANITTLSEMQETNAEFAKYIITGDQRRRFYREMERVHKLHIEQGVGVSGLDWTYEDANGNKVSFSDFRGKVLYMDVWATWCRPCIAEFPNKKKLQQHFAGNDNIAFVSVSIDNPRDLQKWRGFVAEHNLTGIQLHGNIEHPSNITRLYGIKGIPRYLLFDRQGYIVSKDAPSPSSSELVPLLNSLLRQR